ncbi:bifunctional hydroxymethylpyrimidine kinase/phosphomethylpyrimidine kinase [Dendrosporobacter sp. 1207_IL3150]
MNTALTIAGSDSSGGAGIQADLKTFAALGVFGMSVITAITAQNTCGVTNIRDMDAEIIVDQIDAIYDDIKVNAVKIGMLSNSEIIKTVSSSLVRHDAKNIIVDTVMVSKSGSHLLKKDAINTLKEYLIPLALVVTPNLYEASELVGFEVANENDMRNAAIKIHEMGSKYVVVKGGHLPGNACDLLYDGSEFITLANERINTIHTHGTGCTFSSAIASGLAKGLSVEEAVAEAKKFITMAITNGFSLGKGVGPTHHFFDLYRKAGLC